MESIFKQGDIVYHWKYGKGTISKPTLYSYYEVIFEGTEYGIHKSCLSFTPYTLEKGGFSQVRPEPKIEIGQMIWVKNRYNRNWTLIPHDENNYYKTWDEYSLTNPYNPELPCFKK